MAKKEDCIFCKIARHEVPASIIYESESIIAFLDINPVNPGHALVLPKQHFSNLLDMPESLASELMAVMKKIGYAQLKALNAEGFNLLMNNMSAAGQLIMHAHIHVIPRYANDGLEHWKGKPYEEGKAEEVAEKLRNVLNKDG